MSLRKRVILKELSHLVTSAAYIRLVKKRKPLEIKFMMGGFENRNKTKKVKCLPFGNGLLQSGNAGWHPERKEKRTIITSSRLKNFSEAIAGKSWTEIINQKVKREVAGWDIHGLDNTKLTKREEMIYKELETLPNFNSLVKELDVTSFVKKLQERYAERLATLTAKRNAQAAASKKKAATSFSKGLEREVIKAALLRGAPSKNIIDNVKWSYIEIEMKDKKMSKYLGRILRIEKVEQDHKFFNKAIATLLGSDLGSFISTSVNSPKPKIRKWALSQGDSTIGLLDECELNRMYAKDKLESRRVSRPEEL